MRGIIPLQKGNVLLWFGLVKRFALSYLADVLSYADHSPMQYFDIKRHTNSELKCWALRLKEFDKKGKDNLVANCLSHCVHIQSLYVSAVILLGNLLS
jgi:hypothetical protein